ncbi:hypothetical protein V8F33_010673 [Rhypophila sp. PSN 637]
MCVSFRVLVPFILRLFCSLHQPSNGLYPVACDLESQSFVSDRFSLLGSSFLRFSLVWDSRPASCLLKFRAKDRHRRATLALMESEVNPEPPARPASPPAEDNQERIAVRITIPLFLPSPTDPASITAIISSKDSRFVSAVGKIQVTEASPRRRIPNVSSPVINSPETSDNHSQLSATVSIERSHAISNESYSRFIEQYWESYNGFVLRPLPPLLALTCCGIQTQDAVHMVKDADPPLVTEKAEEQPARNEIPAKLEGSGDTEKDDVGSKDTVLLPHPGHRKTEQQPTRRPYRKGMRPWSGEHRPSPIYLYETNEQRAIEISRRVVSAHDTAQGVLQFVLFCDRSIDGITWKIPFQESGSNISFGRRSVCVKEMFSVQQGKITGVSMCLEKAIELLNDHPEFAKSRIIIFCDSSNALDRINVGVGPRQDPSSFYHTHTLAPVRSCIYLGHQLENMGGEVQLHWIPRRSRPAKLADDLAGLWKDKSEYYWRYEFDGDRPNALPSKLRGEILASVEPFFPDGFQWPSTAPAAVQRAAARPERTTRRQRQRRPLQRERRPSTALGG